MSKIHDYRDTARKWGHDLKFFEPVNIFGVHWFRAIGWGHGIEVGDYILLTNGDSDTRYVVNSVRYEADPPDMWWAHLEFAPRSREEKAGAEAGG